MEISSHQTEFKKILLSRCSVRQYQDKPVSRQLIDQCIDAARMAPSACNSQPWYFIVVDNKTVIQKIVKESCSGLFSLNKFIKTSPVLIIMVTEKSKVAARFGGHIRDLPYNLIDIGIAGDHLTLQAAELGLGTCWLGWFNEKGLKKVLNLPEKLQIDILITMGYPDEKPREKVRKSLNEIREYYHENT